MLVTCFYRLGQSSHGQSVSTIPLLIAALMNVLPRAVDLRRARARRARRREPSGRHCSPMDLLHFMPHAQNRRERSAARPSCEAVLRGLYGNFLDPCGLRIKLSSRIDEKTTCRAEPDALSGTSGVARRPRCANPRGRSGSRVSVQYCASVGLSTSLSMQS